MLDTALRRNAWDLHRTKRWIEALWRRLNTINTVASDMVQDKQIKLALSVAAFVLAAGVMP